MGLSCSDPLIATEDIDYHRNILIIVWLSKLCKDVHRQLKDNAKSD